MHEDEILGLRLVDDKVRPLDKPLIFDSVQASRRLLQGFDATLRRFMSSFEIAWIRCEPLSPCDKMVVLIELFSSFSVIIEHAASACLIVVLLNSAVA